MWLAVSGCVSAAALTQRTVPYEFLDGIELMIIIIATFGQAVAGQAKAINILGIIIVWRFIVSRLCPLPGKLPYD